MVAGANINSVTPFGWINNTYARVGPGSVYIFYFLSWTYGRIAWNESPIIVELIQNDYSIGGQFKFISIVRGFYNHS